MSDAILQELVINGIYLLRVAVAALCGFAIGIERRNRFKSAGPRTHLLVAAASALMMVISKYGFYDVIGTDGIDLDPSRVAASIITGITLMGAGLIFVRKREVSGVTTAAGLWATVGVGMAVGAGMYILGIGSCVMIILFQLLMHSRFKFFQEPWTQSICVRIDTEIAGFGSVCEALEASGIDVISPKLKHEDKILEVRFVARIPQNVALDDIIGMISKESGVVSVEL